MLILDIEMQILEVFFITQFFPIVEVLSAMSIGFIVWYGGQGIFCKVKILQLESLLHLFYLYI